MWWGREEEGEIIQRKGEVRVISGCTSHYTQLTKLSTCRHCKQLQELLMCLYVYNLQLGKGQGILRPGLGGEVHETFPPSSLVTSHSAEQPPGRRTVVANKH